MVRQCPKCPLRFDLAPMLADHLTRDHGMDPQMVDHLQPASRRSGLQRQPTTNPQRQSTTNSQSAKTEKPGRPEDQDGGVG